MEFSGLGSERKQKEVEELLAKNNIDVVAGQEGRILEYRLRVTSGLGSLITTRLVREGREGLAF